MKRGPRQGSSGQNHRSGALGTESHRAGGHADAAGLAQTVSLLLYQALLAPQTADKPTAVGTLLKEFKSSDKPCAISHFLHKTTLGSRGALRYLPPAGPSGWAPELCGSRGPKSPTDEAGSGLVPSKPALSSTPPALPGVKPLTQVQRPRLQSI